MTQATLRPDGVAQTGGWTVGGGAASLSAATSDNSDGTWAESPDGVSWGYLGFGTVSIPALAQIRSVTPRLRVGPRASIRGSLQVVIYSSGLYSSTWFTSIMNPGDAIVTLTGSSLSAMPNGSAWTQSGLNDLQVGAARWVGSGLRIYEAYMDVVYNEAPFATITSPVEGSTITTTSAPILRWTYSDPEGDGQEKVYIRLFTGTTPVGNPETEVARLKYSIIVNTQGSFYQLPAQPNGGYIAYIKVADLGSNGRYGRWDSQAFTLNVVAPPVPSIFAVAQRDQERIAVTVTKGSGSPTPEWFVIEVDEGDGTWVTFNAKAQLSGTSVTLYDHLRLSGRYRAYAVDQPDPTGAPEVLIVSAFSAPTSISVLPAPSKWQLRDFLVGTVLNINLLGQDGDFTTSSPEAGAAFTPAGSAFKVIVTDSIYGDEFDMEVFFATTAEYTVFKAMRDAQRTLLLRNPQGEQWFIRFHGEKEVARAGFGNTQKRVVKIKAIEVAPPSAEYVKFVPEPTIKYIFLTDAGFGGY